MAKKDNITPPISGEPEANRPKGKKPKKTYE